MPAFTRAFVVLGVLLFLSFPQKACSFFTDDFTGSSLNIDSWQAYENSGNILVDNSRLYLNRKTVEASSFPYIYSKTEIFPKTGPFSVEIKYRYTSAGNFGDGIAISGNEVPENGVNPGVNLQDFMTFMIWQDATNGLSFGKILCDEYGNNCNTRTFIRPFTHEVDLNYHEVRIDYNEKGQYLLFFDGNAEPEFVSGINQTRPKKIWIGSSEFTSTDDLWSSIEIDRITVSPISSPSTIIIPGFGASWDMPALLAGTSGSNWVIPPYIKTYDGIIKSFENAGYVKDTNLFVFSYDWRKNLDDLADDLQKFVVSKNLSTKGIDLIGHSMGGLVARAYAQKYPAAKINKIITAGSPHFGVIDMYGLWEGAKIWDGVWWQNVLLEIATEINRLPGESKVSAIRRVSPSIIDLFPTLPFLSLNNSLLGVDTMHQKNNYLNTLNQNVASIQSKLTPFWSDDISTTRKSIKVTNRDTEDEQYDRWEDGKPIADNPFEMTIGDGTVTKESAIGPFENGEKLTGWHADLVSTQANIQKIFQKLNLDTSFAISSDADHRTNSFVAILRSPGTLEVCDLPLTKCNDQLGIYFPEYKLFILPGYSGENLVVKVKEAGLGTYKLHMGNIDESPDWIVKDGELKVVGQSDFYGIKDNGGDIAVVFDNIPPTISITSPIPGSYKYINLPALKYLVSDNWDTNPKIVTEGWSDQEGNHKVFVRATDLAGNTAENYVEYTVDNSAPVVTIKSPQPITYQSETLPPFLFDVKDNLDNNPIIQKDELSKSEGQHTVYVKATDKAGNVGVGSVRYTIQNPPKQKDQCKNNLWKLFRLLNFKNQGECVSFVERHKKMPTPYFFMNFFNDVHFRFFR